MEWYEFPDVTPMSIHTEYVVQLSDGRVTVDYWADNYWWKYHGKQGSTSVK